MAIAQPCETRRETVLIILFASTLFCSASLMFVLQPMFGKALLPLLGGTPSVWNTCMVFFQTVLFLGYLYAHLLSRHLPVARQILLHGTVILLSVLSLPVALSAHALPVAETDPILWLLSVLMLSIGLPFFVLSTTAPLLQKWFSQLGHASSDDPYYLYVASNAGSLIALLSYPLLLEPNIGLSSQQTIWSLGFILLCAFICCCMAVLRFKRQPNLPHPETGELAHAASLELKTQFHWLALSFVPSSLLLALTNYISTDIAAVPLLWVIPLALYLISFIIVFSIYGASVHKNILALYPWVIAPFLGYYFSGQKIAEYEIELALHLLVFCFSIMACHGELAKNRPHPEHLTQYYLIMSFGGMLGGMFNTFVAPVIFDNIYEYPLMIICGLLLIGYKSPEFFYRTEYSLKFKLATASVFFGGIVYLNYLERISGSVLLGLLVAAAAAYFYYLHKNFLALALVAIVIVACTAPVKKHAENSIYQARNFYGVLNIKQHLVDNDEHQGATLHVLHNGTTEHGSQLRDTGLRCNPLGYYSHQGPLGQLFEAYNASNEQWNVGIIGLGAGELAAYAKPHQHWSFYELNPSVVDIAKDPGYFSYLQDCAGAYRIYLGDARLMLEKEKQQQYDLLVVDAFSSDSIPMHLMTKEALALFFANMKAQGLLVFHISNRHLALKKVLAGHAEELGLANLIQEFRPKIKTPFAHASDWVVLTKQADALQPLRTNRLGDWTALPNYPGMPHWTDDFTSIISIWKFGKTG